MTLKTNLRLVSGIAIVDVSGNLLSLPEEESLRDRLIRIFDDGYPRILLNLENVEHADSGGLGDLIASYAAITRRGGVVKLLRPQARLHQMLRTTHIASLFEVWTDEAAAVTDFKAVSVGKLSDTLTDFLNG